MLLVLAESGEAPEWIQVFPAGAVHSSKGDFVADAAAMAAVMEAFRALGHDLVVDYEHQTVGGEYQAPDGRAPAAGWITQLEARDDGLWARVNWTDAGARYVTSREYRYLSPVVGIRRSDRRAVVLHSVALTNDPAIRGIRPLAHAAGGVEEDLMMEWLIGMLGLEAGAGEDQVKAAVQAMKELADEAKASLDLKAGTAGELKGSVLALKSNAARAVMDSAELVALKHRLDEREVKDLLDKAASEGKFTPAQRPDLERLALSDRSALEAFLTKATPAIPVGGAVSQGASARASNNLSETEAMICKSLGVTAEEYKAELQDRGE